MKEKPKHVAIIMDGNGRWAKSHEKTRFYGHRNGAKAVRSVLEFSIRQEISTVSLFALSTENFLYRSKDEVFRLLGLFNYMLRKEIAALHKEGVRLKFVGDFTVFPEKIITAAKNAEKLTSENTRLTLIVAMNYSGRWDITQAVERYVLSGNDNSVVTENDFSQYLSMSEFPDPDLLIRTGGDQRVSNFMLWQAAYTEFFFTPTLWPDFNDDVFTAALNHYSLCQRRFGKVLEKV
jgi:undecaprenyl diphosphate synthase